MQRCALWGASVPYRGAVQLRNLLYNRGWNRTERATVPVVSVGNLTAGGTGKTPCVEYVARHFRQQDVRVAILSRGYGSSDGPNDEALVLEENLPDVPHLQGPDRVALAHTAIEELESEILVLDDGFQHRRLARDLDLVLIDATNPWGHGHLLPRGLLREPPAGLQRADLVLLSRCDHVTEEARGRLQDEVARLAPNVPIVETIHAPIEWTSNEQHTLPPDSVVGRPMAAFCGIGNPEAFRRTLTGLGAEPIAFRVFADHHAYTRSDVEDLRGWARRQAKDCVIVTTQKDLVKLRLVRLGERELWALRIGLHVCAGQDTLDRKLTAALGHRLPA
ncbi:MAG: tetraacyldisaccharide 4'-kinase [Gemmataceae bacterium]|nr:tetraacyldisaccharide 4'-kinase [Gemmataceae bacterium]